MSNRFAHTVRIGHVVVNPPGHNDLPLHCSWYGGTPIVLDKFGGLQANMEIHLLKHNIMCTRLQIYFFVPISVSRAFSSLSSYLYRYSHRWSGTHYRLCHIGSLSLFRLYLALFISLSLSPPLSSRASLKRVQTQFRGSVPVPRL